MIKLLDSTGNLVDTNRQEKLRFDSATGSLNFLSLVDTAKPGAFTPDSLNPIAYFDNGASYMAADGSRWIDRVGGFDVTAVGTARPTFTPNALGSFPAFTFDGINDALTRARVAQMQGLSGIAIWGVGNRFSLSQDDGLIAYTQRTNLIHFTNGRNYPVIANGGSVYGQSGIFNSTIYSVMVFDGLQATNATRLRLWVNGVQQALTYLNGNIGNITESNPSAVFRIGSYINAFLAGQSFEFGIVARTINSTEIQNLNTFLSSKYSL